MSNKSINVFFQGIGVLFSYNLAFTSVLARCNNYSVLLGTSQLQTYLYGKLRFANDRLKIALMPPVSIPLTYKSLNMKEIGRVLADHYAIKCDILHLNDLYNYRTFYHAKSIKPNLLTLHQRITNNARQILDMVDCIVSPSKFYSDFVYKENNVSSVVVHHGVDRQLFNPFLEKQHARLVLGLPIKGKIVYWDGRLDRIKDLTTFVKALPLVRKQLKNVYFNIKLRSVRPQTKPLLGNVLQYLRRHNLNRITKVRVKYEWLHRMPYYYRASDLFCHTSLFECFGLTLLEAMACGIPVVAANTATAPEILGNAGLLFSPHDQHDLAEKIVKVLTDEKLEGRLSQGGIERIEKCGFTWKDAAKKYTSLYMSLI